MSCVRAHVHTYQCPSCIIISSYDLPSPSDMYCRLNALALWTECWRIGVDDSSDPARLHIVLRLLLPAPGRDEMEWQATSFNCIMF